MCVVVICLLIVIKIVKLCVYYSHHIFIIIICMSFSGISGAQHRRDFFQFIGILSLFHEQLLIS